MLTATISFCTSKLWLKGGFLFQVWQLATNYGFPGTGKAYVIIWKEPVYTNENEEQPGGFAGRIFKEWYDQELMSRQMRQRSMKLTQVARCHHNPNSLAIITN